MLVIRTTGIEDYLEGGEAFLKALIMGAPSAGKTRSASYWPKPIYADCEKGRMSIADRGVPYGEILTTRDMDKMLEILALECKKPVRDRRYQTLVIDTLDAYQRIVIQERLDSEKKEAFSGWADWGYLDTKMSKFLAKLHSLPMNIVINLHVKEQTTGEDDSKVTTINPKLKGDLKDQIAAEFDLVGFMGTYWEAENGERVQKRGIQWHPDPLHPVLKDRSGQLPKWTPVTFSDEDYATLFHTLTSHLDNLKESETLEQHETDGPPPVAPQSGGPVSSPITPAATPKKAAKPAPVAVPTGATPAPPPAAPAAAAPAPAATTPTTVGSVPAAPKPTAGAVPAAAKPVIPSASQPEPAVQSVPEPAAETPVETPAEPTEEEIAAALGGEVVSVTDAADDSSTGEQPEAEAAEAQVDGAAETAPDGALYCGTGFEGAEPKAEGCGTAIVTDKNGGEMPHMLLEIAQLKTRTNLCAACYSAWRAANKKG